MRHMTGTRTSTLWAVTLTVGMIAAIAAPVNADRAASAVEGPVGGVWQFTATGGAQPFTVPDGITALTAVVVGAAGQPAGTGTAGPGASGMTISTYRATPGDVWTVWVGEVGDDDGGWGFACGGKHGEGRFPGYDGGGGGGASGITLGAFTSNDCDTRPADGSVLAVAGGGGGGGGDGIEPWKSSLRPAIGGAGGDGGDPPGNGLPTTPQGDEGGCGGCADQPNGQDGKSTLVLGGGAGGGGGGFPNGGGSAPPLYAGGGGGGGTSYIGANAERAITQAGTGAGDGYVTLFAGTTQMFDCTGDISGTTVPTDAGAVHMLAVGGQGGTRGLGDGGAGGAGGALEALYGVTPGESVSVTVGCQSTGDETAWGFNEGGRRGIAHDPDGLDGGGGGGSTSVQIGSGTFVVAGGGGGGGGDGGIVGTPGAGSPGGGGGGQGDQGVPGSGNGGHGGCGSCINAPDAPDGWHSSDGTLGGGGGGGGGGWLDGDGGGGGDLNANATGGGGGGGGGGSSFISANAEDYEFVEPGGGDGSVLLLWFTNIANTLSAYGGSKQSAQTEFQFAAPLAVKVTDITGRPVEGVTVQFNLSADGAAGGEFQDGSQNGTAVSDEHGIATSAPIFANATPGPWEALANVIGLQSTARFALNNERLATSVDIAVAPATVTPTEAVTATATVVAGDPFFGTPTGDVIFDVAGTTTTVPLTDGKAVLPLHDLVVGSSQVSVTYGGSATHAPSVGSAPLDVVKTPSAFTLTSSHNPAPQADDITFTARMTVRPGNTVCTGCTVVFTATDTRLGTASTDADGVATFPNADWGANDGPNSVTVSFAGNDEYAAGSGSMVQTIDDNTALAVTATPTITEWGEPIEFSGTVEPVETPYATGAMSFTYGGDSKTICDLGFDGSSKNVVSCPAYSDLPVGTTDILAWYSGDSTHSQVYASYSHRVIPAATTTTVYFSDVSNDPGVVDIGASVHRSTGSATIPPTGTVSFSLDSEPLGDPVPLPADGIIPENQASALPGSYSLVAEYSGDEHYAPSRDSIPITFPKTAATVSLAGAPASSKVGETVELSAHVASAAGDPQPEGFVQFRVDGVDRGAPVSLVDGVAMSSLDGLDADRHDIMATYLPTNGHITAWAALIHQVSQPTTTLLGGPAATPDGPVPTPWAGEPVEFKAHVTPFVAGGTVGFAADGIPIPGCDAVAPGVGTCSTDALGAGTHTITATYSGTDGFEPSDGSLQVTVLGAADRLAALSAAANGARHNLGTLPARAGNQVGAGREFVACILLRAFERQVRVYDRVSLISATEAEQLVGESRAVRSMVGCG